MNKLIKPLLCVKVYFHIINQMMLVKKAVVVIYTLKCLMTWWYSIYSYFFIFAKQNIPNNICIHIYNIFRSLYFFVTPYLKRKEKKGLMHNNLHIFKRYFFTPYFFFFHYRSLFTISLSPPPLFADSLRQIILKQPIEQFTL